MINYSIKEEMGSDLWEMEMLAAKKTSTDEKKTKKPSLASPDKKNKKPVGGSPAKAEKPTVDCTAYYGTKAEILKALQWHYTLINGEPSMAEKVVRDFYYLSLAYVTVGGTLTSLDPGMIPILQH